MQFKDKILFVRAKLNLSQQQIAEKLGVSYETVNRWENGKFKPSRKAEAKFDIFCTDNNIAFD